LLPINPRGWKMPDRFKRIMDVLADSLEDANVIRTHLLEALERHKNKGTSGS